MRISDLREFIRLAQTLNFTQTAREFYVTQSVFSRHIARIEQELGVELFTRTSHGVSLTSVGSSFVVDASKVVADYDRALANLDSLKAGLDEVLVIGYLFGASRFIMSPAVMEFQQLHPKSQLRLVSLELGEVTDAFADNSIDLAIVTSRPEIAFPEDTYCYQPLYDDPMLAIVPKGHPLAERESLTLDDLKGQLVLTQPFLSESSTGEDLPKQFEHYMDGGYLKDTQYDISAVQTMMETGKYVAVTFGHIRNLLGDSYRYYRLPEAESVGFEVGVGWKKEKDSTLLREFVDCLRKQVE